MRHFLNDIEITPRNRTDIGITSNFDDNPNLLNLTTDSIILPREGFNLVMNHLNTTGVFEAMPYRIELSTGVEIQYFLDFTDGMQIRNKEVEIKIKKRKGFDDFKEKADGTSFDLMRQKGVVFNVFDVPYLIVPPNQAETMITLVLAGYILTKETIEAGKQVADAIIELIQAVTPSVGVGVVVDTGDVIAMGLKIIGRIIIFALLLMALLEMATQFFNLIFPLKRNFKASKFKELAEKGCGFLGYTFSSTILDLEPNWTLLPVPLVKDRKSIFDIRPESWVFPFTNGVPSSSDTTPTLGQFLDGLETMFNAKVKVTNGVVHLERWDYWATLTNNQLFPALNLQGSRDEEYEYNLSDTWKRYYIRYQLDYNDLNTLDGKLYDKHDCELSTEALNTINSDLTNIKGLQEVNIPFALGQRKASLNFFEEFAKMIFTLIDSVTGIFGGGTNYASQIGDRRDCLRLSQQYFSVTKALYTSGGKQSADYFNVVSAKSLWDRYHYINSITLNSWKIKKNARIRITALDFVTLLNNNFATIDGELAEILSIEYMDEKSFASISYRIKSNYAQNKVETIVIND